MTGEAVPTHVECSVEVSESGAALVLRISGELDLSTRISIEQALLSALDSASNVILDLRDLTFCDSSGVAMFCNAYQKATTQGATLTFRNVTSPVRRVFTIAGVDERFGLIPTSA
jgi:anti-sigma B factor antagonist